MKERIIKLKKLGKNNTEIAKIIGCSPVNIGYYLSSTIRERVNLQRNNAKTNFLFELKKEAGGKCKICGYNKCMKALDFHHQREKKYAVSYAIKNLSKEKVMEEVKKCILLCCRCHRELHEGLLTI